jgi:YVTN family beta-propeller protein
MNRTPRLAGLAALSACLALVSGCGQRAEPLDTGQSLVREGLRIEFSAQPADAQQDVLMEGGIASLRLKITDSRSKKPVLGLYPAGWVDPLQDVASLTEASCRQSAGTYLSGYVGVRPMVDLNSYYLVVLNEDPTVAVIDPIVGIKGITKLLTQIILPSRGSDWARSADQKKVYVAMPQIGSVAELDLETFKLARTVKVGERPNRIAVQPDGKYAWVSLQGADVKGVSLVDTETMQKVAYLETGAGHHEFAFTSDSRLAFVTNRDDDTVSAIDIAERKIVRTVKTGDAPLSVAWSELSRSAYIAAGGSGDVTVIDAETLDVRSTMKLAPGLGPMRITPDGRYGFVVNPQRDMVHVFDTAINTQIHSIPIEGKPFQVAFSRSYAFVRALETTRVSMIRLNTIGTQGDPVVIGYDAGDRPPVDSPVLLPSDLFAPAVTEAATLAVSPGDATVYYYMEGMNAPMGSFRNYGHRPLSAMIADRTIKEVRPGEYEALLKLPAAGDFQLIMTLDSPQIIHCFSFSVSPDPSLVEDGSPVLVTYGSKSGQIVKTGEPVTVSFGLKERLGDQTDFGEVEVLTYRSPGQDREVHKAVSEGDGKYSLTFTPERSGAYYVFPAIQELGLNFSSLQFITLIAQDDPEGTP